MRGKIALKVHYEPCLNTEYSIFSLTLLSPIKAHLSAHCNYKHCKRHHSQGHHSYKSHTSSDQSKYGKKHSVYADIPTHSPPPPPHTQSIVTRNASPMQMAKCWLIIIIISTVWVGSITAVLCMLIFEL